jgi:hypothetical protein
MVSAAGTPGVSGGGGGAARGLDHARQHRLQNGGVGELDRDGCEQQGKAAGRQHEPATGALHGGAAGEVGGGDAHVFHARHRGVGGRPEAAGRQRAGARLGRPARHRPPPAYGAP